MEHPFRKDPEGQSGSSALVLTPAMFLGKVGDFRYFDTPDDFLSFGEQLRPEDALELKKGIQCMKEGLNMQVARFSSTDRGGKTYTYERFNMPKATMGVKIVHGGRIAQFISDYQQGKFTVGFTLDDLVAEAKK